MSFGEMLKELLTVNDIKMYNLADALGYDKSYISKWVNGAKLPPSKDIDKLTERIGTFMARECDEERKKLTARRFGFAKRDGSTPDDGIFAAKLSELLREEYWKAKYAEPAGDPPPRKTEASPNRTAFGSRRRNPGVECILATQPVTAAGEFQSVLDDLAVLDPDNTRLKMTALIDSERFAGHVDLYWKHICSLLSIGSNADVDLVEIDQSSGIRLPERLLIAKGSFVEQSVRLPFSDKSVSVKTDVPSVVDLYYDDARRFLRRQQPILESSNLNNNLYYFKYSSNTQKRYLLSSMFPMYMSEGLYDEILDKYGTQAHKAEQARGYYLKEFVTDKSVVIFETALLRYMSTGKISAFDAYEGETLTRQERRRHLQELIDELEDGSRFDLKILGDKNPIINYEDISVSFFANENSAYCSDIRKKKDGIRYFVSSDSRKNLRIFLDHIHALSDEHLMTGKRVIDYIYDGMKNM
ncbi:MAG: helix-turn-helix transcriptional regulator [Oscillospiraceae bacterium]|nr:helix-turn-helix transcriptional regulator [Oscillospiraceae bacterium]